MVVTKLRRKVGKMLGVAKRVPARFKQTSAQGHDPLAQRIFVGSDPTVANAADKARTSPQDGADFLDAVKARVARAQSGNMDIKACLDRITFVEPVSQDEVLECLRTFGLAIFPSIYDAGQLVKIQLEYEDFVENGADLARNVDAREETPANSYAISLQRAAISEKRFKEISALFGSQTIEQITEKFFAGQSFDFNSDLYVQWTDQTDVPASGPLHWDKQLTLKSWLYVTDATEGYGAMRAGVGTAAWTRYIREDAMFEGVPYGKIINQVDEKSSPVVSTGGPAGTFFLFVTDTAHGATPVDPGKRRNIIRARSRPHRIRQWTSWAGKL